MKCEPVLRNGIDPDQSEVQGACHCGGIRFRATLSSGLRSARRCNCSLCRMRGAIAISAKLADFEVLEGADKLTLYQFNTKTAKHYFCSVCGIYTHHQRRSDPTQFGINVACLEGISPFDFEEVWVTQGVHHPSDKENADRSPYVGILKYEAFSD